MFLGMKQVIFLQLLLTVCYQTSFPQSGFVFHIGEMKQLHRMGNAIAVVEIDTMPKKHLYAVGPVALLQGELFIWDGRLFMSSLTSDTKRPFVKKDPENAAATFLVYTYVPAWDTIPVFLNASDMNQLESEIRKQAALHGTDTSKPFPFLMLGKFAGAKGHIVFADKPVSRIQSGTLERYKHYYRFGPQKAQLIGFYSSHHAGVFTHHDSKLHIHYRMYNKYEAGHLDDISFDGSQEVLLLLPAASTHLKQ